MYKPYDTQVLGPADKSEHIRILNDAFRAELIAFGSTFVENTAVLSRGVAVRGNDFVRQAVEAVRTFSDFTEDNDPHGEHDFGSFKLDGVMLFWKINYHNCENVDLSSPDPANPSVTRRVLTILLAREY